MNNITENGYKVKDIRVSEVVAGKSLDGIIATFKLIGNPDKAWMDILYSKIKSKYPIGVDLSIPGVIKFEGTYTVTGLESIGLEIKKVMYNVNVVH